MRDTCPPEEIKEFIAYDPITGLFTWKKNRRRARAGAIAGYRQRDKKTGYEYWALKFAGREYISHRVAWWMMTGEWPEHSVDHGDIDSFNNRWENLRPASQSGQNANRRRFKNNKSGVTGVRKLKSGKWCATIAFEGKSHWLGSFPEMDAAIVARLAAEPVVQGEFARVK
jgi:hypothetical protein